MPTFRDPVDPVPEPSPEQQDILDAVTAWNEDPEDEELIEALQTAYAAAYVVTFVTADDPTLAVGNAQMVVYKKADGTQEKWCTCSSATDATDTAAALVAKLLDPWTPD